MSEIRQSRSDIFIGSGLLAFCAFAAWRTLRIRAQTGGTAAGPSFLPWVMIVSICVLAVWLIIRALRERDAGVVAMPDRGTLMRMGCFAVLLVAYAAAFMPLGYMLSTIIASAIGLWLLEERRWQVLVVFPVAMTGVVYLGFTRFLQVWLP